MESTEIPRGLGQFDEAALRSDPNTLVVVQGDGRIAWTNPAWERFALENHGEGVLRRFGPGASYLDGISGPLRGFYREAIEACAASRQPFEHDYECSSSGRYRNFRLRMLPLTGGQLLLSHSLVIERAHDRAACPPVESRYASAHGFLTQCSNCRRMRRLDDGWDWVPEWINAIPERVSHGLCPLCEGFYWGTHLKRRSVR